MLVLRLLLAIVSQGLLIETKSALPEAVAHAIANSFNNTAQVLHVVIETDFEENTLSFRDTVQIILEKHWTFRIKIDINNKIGQAVSDHNLWFVDSYKSFGRLLPWIRAYHRDSQLFYFIVLSASNMEKQLYLIKKIFSDFLALMLGNLNIIVETTSGEVLFYTFYPYQEHACRSAEPFITFRWHNITTEDRMVQFFPSKADKFHECTLRIQTRNELVLTLGGFNLPNQLVNYEISVLELVIIKELSSVMNFTFEIHNITDNGPYKLFLDENIDVIFGSYSKGPKENHVFSTSPTYLFSWLVIALQIRPDILRTLVWLLVPFNSTTWSCTFWFLILTTGCIVLVRENKKLVKIFNLRNSGGLEILAVTIGTSVEHLPTKNSLRFAFVILSLGALIIRSAYLGKLFDAYRGFTTTKSPHSILELLAENYTIYCHNVYKPIIDDLIGADNYHFKDLEPYQGDFNVLSDAGKKNAFVVSFVYIYTFYTAEQLRGIILKSVLRQQVCMFFPQHSMIVPRVNEIIMKMEEAGILHHLRKKYENYVKSDVSLGNRVLKPIPLVLERFQFTFFLFGTLNSIASLIFIIELLCKRFSTITHKCK